MRTLAVKYKKKKRRANHILHLRNTIANLHNEIVNGVLECAGYGKISINLDSSIVNKARLLKKYNRRLKLITFLK
jgi:hypothetical protein